jgi:uncharacterized membrane protein YphA (DoxX/SURF4 family)
MKAKTENLILTLTATRPMWGMIALRVIFGVILILEGVSRFTMVREGDDTLISLIPGGIAFAIVVFFAVVEMLGGTLAILGLATRATGALIMIEMSIAMIFERVPLDFSRDLQTQMLFFAIATILFFSGAGRYSIDRMIARALLKKYPSKKKELYCIAETPYVKWYE